MQAHVHHLYHFVSVFLIKNIECRSKKITRWYGGGERIVEGNPHTRARRENRSRLGFSQEPHEDGGT
jgi:hypothetical protein